MHKNPLWLALLALIGCFAFWSSVNTLYKAYNYWTLSQATFAQVERWSIQESDPESYKVVADYTFKVNGSSFRNETVFNDWSFRNPWGAHAALKEREKQEWQVWYSPRNPHHSSLQKSFPLKECISMVVLWGLFFYFLWLGSYVARYQR